MHDDRRLLEGRLARFTSDHLTRAVHRATVPLTLEAWPVPGEPVPFAEAVTQQYEPIQAGTPFVLQPGGESRKVLVVDDNVDQALSLGTLLRLLGHDVRIAHDGSSALPLAREFNPEIALIDLGMPGLNGYELARSIRADAFLRGMLLVAQTGWGQAEDRRRSSEAGFDEHLVKPLRPEDLQRVLETRRPAG